MPIIQQYGMESGSALSLMDVGTGAGFPGLVLAAALPELAVTLVEPRQKRVSFLRHIIRTLELINVRIVDQRIEVGKSWDGPECRFITSRAVAAKETFLPLIEGIAGKDAVVIMMGATNGTPEDGLEGQGTSGWIFLGEHRFSLPFSGDPRILTLWRKSG